MSVHPHSQGSRSNRGRGPVLVILVIAFVVLAAGIIYWIFRDRASGEVVRTNPTGSSASQTPDPDPAGPTWFRDMTSGSSVDFTHRNGEEANQFTLLESLGGGVALIDFDGDGLLDIFVAGGGYFEGNEIRGNPCRLYRNVGNWKFQDVTREVGLDIGWWYTCGVAVADYDRDGWPDLLVTGYGKLALFHNEAGAKGGRQFRDVSGELGLRDTLWSTSAAWGDLDGDGYPDLYVCHYVDWSFANHPKCVGNAQGIERDICNPERFKPLVHSLFKNDKGNGFRDIGGELGFKANGCGLGVVWADLNDDGRPDIYVANDTNNNFLYFNRGGKLEEKAQFASAAADENGHPDGSMGVDVGDYDGSGRASIFVTNFQNEVHALYENRGKELFYHQSRAAGVAALSKQLVGFGTAFVDFDNDGWQDLIFVNGHVWRYPVAGSPRQRPVLLRNGEFEGRRFFKDVSTQGGTYFRTPSMGRGLAVGDLDNDGWPDIVVSHNNGPITLLRNEGATLASNKWVGLKLVGEGSRDIAGSTVVLESDTRRQTRFVKGGGSYLSPNDSRIIFGLGADERIQRITVKWSWGQSQTVEKLEANFYWELRENSKVPVRLPLTKP